MAFDPLSFIIGQQTAKGSGGGSGGDYSDIHFVTFMSEDGSTELYKRPVADGDDCADPVIRGLISEPTKESTAQYNYTLVGWSATPNGALDENILKSVTTDKTVYANFASVLRYYTITYYDSDGTTVLKTESLAYGATPTYKPTKDEYDFVAWTPDAVVTGNMSYTATWKEKAAFGTTSWAEISAITTAGTSANTFKVGDTRDEVLTYADGTTENIEFVIAHIYDDGRLVICLNHALKTQKQIHSSANSSQSNIYNNDLGIYLTDTVFPALSEELKAVVREDINVGFVKRKIALLTQYNANGTSQNTDVNYTGFSLYATQTNRIRKLGKDGTVAITYWLNDSKQSVSIGYRFGRINEDGSITVASKNMGGAVGITDPRGVVFYVVV